MSGQPASSGDGKVSRRDFLKLLAAAGTVVTFTPFIDWGKFLPNPAGSANEKGKVELPDGSQVNVKTFKVNHSEAIIYPKSDDPALNEELLGHGNLSAFHQSWEETKMRRLHLGSIVWFVYICGVYGNTGQVKEEKEENVLVTEVI